jgi:hypothetical protein
VAVFRPPLVLLCIASNPIAVLSEPVLVMIRGATPSVVFSLPLLLIFRSRAGRPHDARCKRKDEAAAPAPKR